MSGPHPDLPQPDDPLGYTAPVVQKFLGLRWGRFLGWLREDLQSWDEQGRIRYWPGDLHAFLHQGELFDPTKKEV